ncbi:MAG: hypothetical protein JXB14_06320 [Candidatus Altiarchaeota archaeon]|nr:hypothetical protein [Candidatus Altiarchaeota archaeon]
MRILIVGLLLVFVLIMVLLPGGPEPTARNEAAGSLDDKINSCILTAGYDEKNFCSLGACTGEVTAQDAVYCLEDLAKKTAKENVWEAKKVCVKINEIVEGAYGEGSMMSLLYYGRCQEFIS